MPTPTTLQQNPLISYRLDVDGLRAIAIIFVLIFHAGFNIFPSGFIGVDIFFVISGFLITAIINSSITNGSFSLSSFYVRRLWRLQPAFIAVMLFTFILAIVFYLPNDLIDYLRSSRSATAFFSNLYFERATTTYFAPESAYLLLLHTWSLSIEWQWYLLLPISLLVLHRYFSSKQIVIIALIIAIGMTGLSLYSSQTHPDLSYYFLSSRIFEFMIGSLVAMTLEKIKLTYTTSSLLGVFSFIALIYCATRQDIVLGYPDYHSVIVCISTALLILAGTNANCITSRILSIPPLVFIGSISYSLYLWHWPIFATARYLGFEEDGFFKIICFTLTFITAYISYMIIEKPLRKKRWSLFKSTSILLLLPILISVLAYQVAKNHNGFTERFGPEYSRANKIILEHNSPKREICIGNNIESLEECTFGSDKTEHKTALMLGDSYSNHLLGFMDVLAKDANVSVQQYTTSSCLMLPGIYLFDWGNFKNRTYDECHSRSSIAYDTISKNNYDYVILAQSWPAYINASIINSPHQIPSEELTKENLYFSLKNSVEQIIASGATPVLIRSTFTGDKAFRDCFNNRIKMFISQPSECIMDEPEQNNDWINITLTKVANEYPKIIIIDPKLAQCQNGICYSTINNIPVYRIGGHIHDYASYQYGAIYLNNYTNPFLSL